MFHKMFRGGGFLGTHANQKHSSKLDALLRKLHNASAADSAVESPAPPLSSSKPNSPLSPSLCEGETDQKETATSPAGVQILDEKPTAAGDTAAAQDANLELDASNDDVSEDVKTDVESKQIEQTAEPSRSSRRKQQKTRKVVEPVLSAETPDIVRHTDGDGYADFDFAEYSSDQQQAIEMSDALLLFDSAMSSPSDSRSVRSRRRSDASSVSRRSLSEDDHRLLLPEGTVFVQPEAVDSSPVYRELDSSRTKSKFKGNFQTAILNCTSCNKQIGADSNPASDVQRHPVLKVLICKKCHKQYSNSSIEKDQDGSDEQCRWCCQGGDLICCDFCHNAICKKCIRRNLGRKELNAILSTGEGERWRCYVCDPKPLLSLIEHCNSVVLALPRLEKQESESKRKPDPNKTTAGKTPTSTKTPTSVAGKISTPAAAKTPASASGKVQTAKMAQPVSVIQTAGPRQKSRIVSPGAVSAGPRAMLRMVSPGGVLGVVRQSLPSVQHGVRPQGVVPSVRQQQMPQHAIVNANNVVVILDRLVSATNSMHIFLQSLRGDARTAASLPPQQQYDKRHDIAGKLARAYTAYARSFADAASQCHSGVGGTSVPRPAGPARAPGSIAVASARIVGGGGAGPSPTAVNVAMQSMQRLIRKVRPPGPPPSTAAASQVAQKILSMVSESSEVINLDSDSEDEHATNVPKSRARSVLKPSEVAPPGSPPAGSEASPQTSSASSAKKRKCSPEWSPMVVNVTSLVKRGRNEKSVSDKKDASASSSGSDVLMFDGGVDEIPNSVDNQNNASAVSAVDEQNLQMDCVDVDEEDDQSAKQTEPKSMLTNGKAEAENKAKTNVENGVVVRSSKTRSGKNVVEDCNQNEACSPTSPVSSAVV